jgi:hypothetical protein
MNLSGYVQLRRGILDHTISGDLSLQEFAAFTVLVLLADKSTGAGKINGPVLRTWLPGLSEDGAKRVLQSLEEKQYLFRRITPRSPLAYPYWVNRYRPTVGPHKLRQLSLEQVFQTKDPNDIRYIDTALEGALETSLDTALEGALDTAHYNKTEKKKDKLKEKPSIGKVECASSCLPNANDVSTAKSAAHAPYDPGDAHAISAQCAHGDFVAASDYRDTGAITATPRSAAPGDPKFLQRMSELNKRNDELRNQ